MSGNPTLIKSYPAAADTEGNLLARLTGTADQAGAGSAATDALIGVTERMGADAGKMLDVVLSGTYQVRAGGDIVAGQPVTSNGAGRGVAATPTVGVIVRYAGFALAPAEDGDLFPMLIVPGIINTPAA